MFNVLRDRFDRYSRSFLCFAVICILIACTGFERPEIEKLSYTVLNSVSTITAPEGEINDVVSDEITGYSVLKTAVSRNQESERIGGFGVNPAYALINGLFILAGTCVLFLLHFGRTLITSHHFIITYIHALDGMKSLF